MRLLKITRKAWIHVLVWAAFIAYELTVTLLMQVPVNLLTIFAYYLLDILLFYGNAHVLFNYAHKNGKKLWALLSLIILELAIFTALTLATGVFLYELQHNWQPYELTAASYIKSIWRGIYMLGLSTAYWFAIRTIEETKRANSLRIAQLELERNLVKSQNAYLRAQINPHLLFNTLNFIYHSVQDVSFEASESVLLLTDVMRYAFTEIDEDGKVELWKEAEQIERFVELNQLRFNQQLCLDLDIWIIDRQSRIPPLLLLTFVENVFKHGDLEDKKNRATITIQCKDGQLHLRTINKKRKSLMESSHIGLTNVTTRLKNYYLPEQYALTLKNDSPNFIADLKICL